MFHECLGEVKMSLRMLYVWIAIRVSTVTHGDPHYMASRLVYLLAIGHLLIWSAACSQQASRTDGADGSMMSGSTISDLRLRGFVLTQ